MKTYFALQKNRVFNGSFAQCYLWGKENLSSEEPICKLAMARPENRHARIVGELDIHGFRFINCGRTVPVKSLRRRYG